MADGKTTPRMGGWKTWTGAALVGVAAALEAASAASGSALLGEIAKVVAAIGAALGLVGVGHKVEKAAATKREG